MPVQIQLPPFPASAFRVTLDTTPMLFLLRWCPRLSRWRLDIQDEAEVPLLSGVLLVPRSAPAAPSLRRAGITGMLFVAAGGASRFPVPTLLYFSASELAGGIAARGASAPVLTVTR